MSENLDYELYWKQIIKSADHIRVSNDSGHILTSSSKGYVHFIDSSGNLIWKNQITNIRTISISEDAKYVAVGSMEELFVFSIDGKLVWKKNVGKINAIAISTTANSIAVGTDLGTLFNFNLSGDELWKKKVRGVFAGGIFYTEESDSIVLGSWNKILCFSGGEVLWEHKTKTRIENADVFNNLIAICTRRGLEVIDNKGNLIFISEYPYKKIAIRDVDHIYALTNSKINILNNIGETIQTLEFKDDLIDFALNRKNGDVTAVSKSYAYSYSTALKPHFRICTNSVLFGETQPIEFEIQNVCGKKIDCRIEVTSGAFHIPDKLLAVELAPYETKPCSIMATPKAPGDNEIIFNVVNKNVMFSDNIHVDIEKINLETILYPKYKFNVADDPITCLVDIKNNSGLVAKNISIKGNPDLFFEELLPGSKHTFNFKIDLNEGTHNISKNITCEDAFGNQYESFCETSVQVENAPYVWKFLNIENLINGKKSLVALSLKNITDKTVDLNIEVDSKDIDFSQNKFVLSIDPYGDEIIDLEMFPNKFGELTVDLSVIENNHEKSYSSSFKVSPSPPSLAIKASLLKEKYVAGEPIVQQLELTNQGDEPALNVEIDQLPKIPSIQPNVSLTRKLIYESKETEHKRLPPVIAKYENDAGEKFEVRCDKLLHFDVVEKKLEISTPDLSVIEHKSKPYSVTLENRSNEVIENVECEFRVDPKKMMFVPKHGDPEKNKRINLIQPMSKEIVEYKVVSLFSGTFEFEFIARFDGTEIISNGNVVAETKLPEFKITVDDSNLVINEYALLTIHLQNTSEITVAKKVSLKLKMPHTDLGEPVIDYRHNNKLCEIQPGQSASLEFDFKPNTSGTIRFNPIVSFESAQGIRHELSLKDYHITIRRSEVDNKREPPQTIKNYYGDVISEGDKTVDVTAARINTSMNQPGLVENLQPQYPQAVLTQTDMPEPERLKMYRNTCVKAFDDAKISDDERNILDIQAEILKLSVAEKEMIEKEIFGEFLNKTNMVEAYKKLYYNALTNDGKISSDERKLLDTIRENLNLSAEEQNMIEDELRRQVDIGNYTRT